MSFEVGDAAIDHPFALRPGTTLDDRYRLLRSVGGSSCSSSYLAQDDRTNELVLIEEFLPRSLVSRDAGGVVRPHTPSDEAEFTRAAKRFVREGDRLSEINHPNLLRVHRAFEVNGTSYVVMSHREAVPLPGFVSAVGGRLAAAPATELVRRLLDALEAMHAEGIFHRMLSPASVFVDAGGRPWLMGVSASRHLPSQARDLVDGFAPIELYGSRGVGPWTDVYSASALLYYLLTGAPPTSAIDRAAGLIVAAPTSIVGGLPPAIVAAMMRGLAQLPEQRPHSASELARQLAPSAQGSTAPMSAALPAAAAPPTMAPPETAAEQHQGYALPAAAAPPPLLDQSTALRLSAGVVMPEHDNLAGRVKKWLSGYRQRSEDGTTDEEQAILDVVGRMGTPDAPVAPVAPMPVIASLPPAPAPAVSPPSAPAPVVVTQTPVPAPVVVTQTPAPAPVVVTQAPAPAPVVMTQAPAPAAAVVAQTAAPDPIVASAPPAPEPVVVPELPDPVAAAQPRVQIAPDPEPAVVVEAAERYSLFELTLPSFDASFPAVIEEPSLPTLDEFSERRSILRPTQLRLAAIVGQRTTRTVWTTAAVLLLAAALGGAAWASRSSTGRDSRDDPAPTASKSAGTPLVASAPVDSVKPVVRAEAAGAIQQGGQPAASDSSRGASRAERAKPPVRTVESRPDSNAAALAGLANVSVPLATPNNAPQLLPGDVVIDIRDRLSQGRLLTEGGDYAGARRALRAALTAIDSAGARYVSSDALRSLRRDVEKEAQNALDACNAENDIRKRRDGKTLPCG